MPRLHLASRLLALAFITVIGSDWYLWYQRMESERLEAVRNVFSLLDIKIRAYQAHVDRELQHLDKVALFLRESIAQQIDSAALIKAINSRMDKSEDRACFFMLNREGAGVFPCGGNERWMHFRNHEVFSHSDQGASDVAKIGLLKDSDTHAGGRIFVSRAIYGNSGKFAGVIVGSAASSYFTGLYTEEDFGRKGEISILHEDGRYVISQLDQQMKWDVAADFSSVVRNIYLARRSLQPVTATIDGVERYQALLHTGEYPFITVGGMEKQEALASYYKEREASKSNLALMTFLLVLLAAACVYSLELFLKYRKGLVKAANYDRLTGLYNRNAFQMLSKELLVNCDKAGKKGALIFIDLDNFKIVNDSLGHEKGDALLSSVAKNLLKHFPNKEHIFRLGGDEFVILAMADSTSQIEQLGRRAVSALNQPVKLGEHELNVSGSVGISVYPDNGDNISALLKNADIAMYESKAGGRNQMHFFDEPLSSRISMRAQMEEALGKAINGNQIFMLYQPIVDLVTLRPIALEALVRWRHPARGILTPAEFIPIAEEAGLIPDLTDFVLRHALADVAKWRAEGFGDIKVAVNISASDLAHPRFVSRIADLLASRNISGDVLELELTESVLMKSEASGMDAVEQLRKLGVTVALDDFGTGYSSLSYLSKFAVDKIKIDGGFVKRLPDPDAAVLIKAIVNLGVGLNLAVVAEGIETKEQHEFLAQAQCHYGQGYLFSIPIESHIVSATLAHLRNGSQIDGENALLRESRMDATGVAAGSGTSKQIR